MNNCVWSLQLQWLSILLLQFCCVFTVCKCISYRPCCNITLFIVSTTNGTQSANWCRTDVPQSPDPVFKLCVSSSLRHQSLLPYGYWPLNFFVDFFLFLSRISACTISNETRYRCVALAPIKKLNFVRLRIHPGTARCITSRLHPVVSVGWLHFFLSSVSAASQRTSDLLPVGDFPTAMLCSIKWST